MIRVPFDREVPWRQRARVAGGCGARVVAGAQSSSVPVTVKSLCGAGNGTGSDEGRQAGKLALE